MNRNAEIAGSIVIRSTMIESTSELNALHDARRLIPTSMGSAVNISTTQITAAARMFSYLLSFMKKVLSLYTPTASISDTVVTNTCERMPLFPQLSNSRLATTATQLLLQVSSHIPLECRVQSKTPILVATSFLAHPQWFQ